MVIHPDHQQRIALGAHTYEISWLTDTRAGQAVLAEAYRSGLRPRCLCISNGVEMYVGRRASTFYLARMPGSGLLHDPACPSMENVNLFSGAAGYAPGTLLEQADGHLSIPFDANTPRQLGGSTVGINGLLDLLLDTANLNAWCPGKSDRSWSHVRTALLAAAESISLNNIGTVASLLLAPAQFDRDNYDQHRIDQEAFLSFPGALRLILAPLREIKPTAYGWQLALKHAPRSKFWVSRCVGAAVEADAAGTISLAAPAYPALCLAQVRRTRGDGFAVTAMALRQTDRRFLPCLSQAESAAADYLAAHGIAHLRPLRFDLPWDAPLCDLALTAGRTMPSPVFVMDPTGCTTLDETKHATYRVLASGPMEARSVGKGQWTPPLPTA